jgi:hypothetical protein
MAVGASEENTESAGEEILPGEGNHKAVIQIVEQVHSFLLQSDKSFR